MNELTKNVVGLVDKFSAEYGKTITDYQWSIVPDAQLYAAKVQLTKSEFIQKIAVQNPASVKEAIINAAILGIDLTEGKRQGYLLPRKVGNQQKIVLQVGYKGVEAIAQRMGTIDRLTVRIVREQDSFDWSGDDADKPSHKADWFADRGPIIGAFAITYYPDGSTQTVVEKISNIYEKHRDHSDSYRNYETRIKQGQQAFPPPWVSHEEAMIKKTMAYIASKEWPANIRDEGVNSRILETLHTVDVADYEEMRRGYTQEQRDMAQNLIEEDSALGFHLLKMRIGHELLSDIVSDLKGELPPRVKKGEFGRVAFQKKIEELSSVGLDIYTVIQECAESNDILGVAEQIEDEPDSVISELKTRIDPAIIEQASQGLDV